MIGVVVVLSALVSLAGWIFGVSVLTRVVPGFVSMKANTAMGFVLLGLAFILRGGRDRGISPRMLGGAVALIGSLTLVQYLSGVSLGIDELLFEDLPDAVGTSHPGRMAPTTALCLVLLGAALVVHRPRDRTRDRAVDALAFSTCAVAMIGVTGYLFGVEQLYGIASLTQMALPTAIMFVASAVAALLLAPTGLAGLLRGTGTGSLAARRLLPWAVVLSPALLSVRWWAERRGLFTTAFGLSLTALIHMVLLIALVVVVARRINAVDVERRRTREILEAFLSHSPMAMYLRDMDGTYVFANRTLERFLGADIERGVTSDRTLFGATVAERIRNEDEGVARSGRVLQRREEIGPRVFDTVRFAVRSPEGGLIGIGGVATDVSDREAARRTILEQEERLRLILDSTKEGLLVVDGSGRIIETNPAALSLTSAALVGSISEALGRIELYDSSGVRIEDPVDTPTGRALRGEAVDEFEMRVLREDGEAWLLVNARPLRNASGEIIAAVSVFSDNTERRETQQRLRTVNAELERRVEERTAMLESTVHDLEAFSYSVSHDLRTPLRHIDGFAKLLEDNLEGRAQPEDLDFIERIRGGAQRMATLIDDLLDYSRVGRRDLVESTVDVDGIVRRAVDEARSGERVVDVRIEALPACTGDPAAIRQLFSNLIENAFKFTSERQEAHIEVGAGPGANGSVTYHVRDNGVGFDMAYADKLFGVFQRMHDRSRFEGTGVGLATVRRIARRHGGDVRVESEPDEGTTFYVTLPTAPVT